LEYFLPQGKYFSLLIGMKNLARSISLLDVFMSLAEVSLYFGYNRPNFNDTNMFRIQIEEFRNPLLEQKSHDQFISNSISLEPQNISSYIITGPNMGGKSTLLRSVALICIMAQIGCFVPAKSASLSIIDAIFCRMGASDQVLQGMSTFAVEMKETEEILEKSTSESLILLDELGRGTSRFDGAAIAWSVFDYLLTKVRCAILFVTHYYIIAKEMSLLYPSYVGNFHMSYQSMDSPFKILCTYKLKSGICPSSFAIITAEKAGLPENVISLARFKSFEVLFRQILRRYESIVP
jgi:DNA mismatch repair protein MSH3